MAIKKDETEKKVETKETKKAKVDDGLVEVFIPIDYSSPDETTMYVAVNGVAILVPRGKKVKVKPEYAALIEQSLALSRYQYQKEAEARAKANQEFINTSY